MLWRGFSVDSLHYEKFADGTVKEVEVPFDIPDSWSWTRFNSAVINRDGERKPISKALREHRQGQYDYYGASGVIDSIDDYLFDKPLMLVGEDGANLLTRRTPIAFIARGKYWVNNHAHVLDGISESFLEFISQFINSISLAPYVTGTAQPKMNQAKMNSIMVAIAPENEQIRILEKINHLFSKVDTYKSHYQNLDKLNKEFPEKLRKSILQYAMQGKLVPQDPNDEPVEVLLEKIRQEKQKLFEEGKLRKKDLQESIIYKGDDNSYYEKVDDGTVKEIEVPFNVPTSWKWVRFSAVSSIVRGGSPRPIKEFITEANDGINWIKIGDTDKGGKFINSTKEKIKPSGLNKTRFVTQGTFLLTNSMSFGRPYILNVDGAIHDGWLAISNYEKVFSRDFLYLVLSSNLAYSQFLGLISGAVVKNLNSDKVASLLVPVPPLMEQTRIVNQVEELNYQISQLHE